MLYVLIAGFLVPLRPGVLSVTPFQLRSSETFDITVEGYNTHFDDAAHELRAYIKIDSVRSVEASGIKVVDRKTLTVTFDLPATLPDNADIVPGTLVLDDSEEGFMVVPSAFSIKKNPSITDSPTEWNAQITPRETEWTFSFPFRSILYETIRNTFFHVAIWMAMFVLLIVSLVYSIKYLRSKRLDDDAMAAAFTYIAVFFGLIGMATGSVWAKNTWGVYWTNDPKLNMSAVALMIYVAYLILRSSVTGDDRKAQISAAYNIFAFAAMIPLIFVIPRMTSSLHPGNGGNPALGGEDLDNTLRMVFYPAIIGLTLIGTWISTLLYRVDRARLRHIKKGLNQNRS